MVMTKRSQFLIFLLKGSTEISGGLGGVRPFYSQQQSPSLAPTMKKQEEKSEMSWQVDA